MMTLDQNGDHTAIINSFTVGSDRADMIVAELVDATKKGTGLRPDFVSADRHASSGRKHITNYVRSRSQADTGATMADATSHACMEHAVDTATAIGPISYELHDSVTV